jgi:hypothetical protein
VRVVDKAGILYATLVESFAARIRHDLVGGMASLNGTLEIFRSAHIRTRASGKGVVVCLAVVVSPGNVAGLVLD